jgi:hypothetical protein
MQGIHGSAKDVHNYADSNCTKQNKQNYWNISSVRLILSKSLHINASFSKFSCHIAVLHIIILNSTCGTLEFNSEIKMVMKKHMNIIIVKIKSTLCGKNMFCFS